MLLLEEDFRDVEAVGLTKEKKQGLEIEMGPWVMMSDKELYTQVMAMGAKERKKDKDKFVKDDKSE